MTVGPTVRRRLRRLAARTPSILQCSVAAAVAWIVAKDLLGHPSPFFAPVAVVVCIGVSMGRRVRRMLEMVAGVSLGVGVGDLLVAWIGSGPWQIAGAGPARGPGRGRWRARLRRGGGRVLTRVVTAQLRSITVDLLMATGTDRETATAALPPVTA
ncbi:FUSC family protein [Sphaerisporangium sp. NPDC004334]